MLAEDTQQTRVALRDVVATIFRYKKSMFVVFVGTSMTVALFALLGADIYQSDATILIRPGRENMAVDPTIIGPTQGGGPGFAEVVRTELSIVTSRNIAESVVAKVGAERILQASEPIPAASAQESRPAPNPSVNTAADAIQEKAVQAVMKNFNAAVVASTIELRYSSKSRTLAQYVLREIVEAYLRRHVEIYAYAAAPEVFEANSKEMNDKLTTCEDELEKFRSENNLASLADQKQKLIGTVSSLEDRIGTLKAEESAGIARLAALNAAQAGRPEQVETNRSVGMPNPTADSLKQKLMELRMEEVNLQSKYVDSYKPLVVLREQRAAIEKALAKEPDTGTSTSFGHDGSHQAIALQIDQEEASIDGKRAEADALAVELDHVRDSLRTLCSQEVALARLERNAKTAETEYLRYSDNVSRVATYAAFDQAHLSNVTVVQSATLPIKPITRKTRTVLLGVFLGFVFAVGIACAIDYFDDSLRTRADVYRRLDLPVLAVIHDAEFKVCV